MMAMRPKGFEPKRVATKLPGKCERENDKQKKMMILIILAH